VERFQADCEIAVDGRVGKETRNMLLQRHGC